MARFPRFKPGQTFGLRGPRGTLLLDQRAADILNLAAREMTRLGNLSVQPPLRLSDTAAGRLLAIDRMPRIWVKLSGAGNPYSWIQQQYDAGTNTFSDMAGGRTGTSNCYESKGKSGLAGKVVQIAYQPTAGDWRFQWVGFGCNNTLTFTLQRCGTNTCPIVGASVDFVLGGVTVYTGVTNASGQVAFTGANPGTYDINWTLASPSLSGSFTGVFVVTGACESLGSIKHMATPPGAPPYACSFCGPEPVPQLFITDSEGTRATDVCTAGASGGFVKSQIFPTFSNCANTGTLITVRTVRYGAGDATCTGPAGLIETATNVPISCTRPFSASGNYPLTGVPFTVHE